MMKKELIAIGIAIVLLISMVLYFGINAGEAKVKFQGVSEKVMPREIEAEIMPEYRKLERALACKIGEEIYVIVTRGEKPTVGYEVEISKIALESKDDKTNLIVYANFVDPAQSKTLAQVITYPYAVCKTNLTGLPDTIQLKSKFIE